jgi:glycosyltransferase involved in cell wall biosynthesis
VTRRSALPDGWVPTVVHVSPTYFGPESIVGGGERYAEDLSRAMAERLPVRFVSFGARAYRERIGERYERAILGSWTRAKMTPFSPRLWNELRGAAAIHCYQFNTLPTFLAALFGRLHRVATFVSDLGGGGWTPGYHLDLSGWIRGQLPISQYAARHMPGRCGNAGVIYGGVDLARFRPRATLSHDGSVVFLGRILPHKGIHFLIEAVPDNCPLRVIGPVGSVEYLDHLKRLAKRKRVEFLHTLTDAEVAAQLRAAAVLVHPTPTDSEGRAGASELLGLAVLEAMASNCPVVVSDAASLPELVVNGISGLVIPPNDPGAIRRAIETLLADRGVWLRLATEGRKRVEDQFAWPKVVERCLQAYGLPASR